MRLPLLFLVVLISTASPLLGQIYDKPKETEGPKQKKPVTWETIKPRLRYGGTGGISFQQGYTYLSVSPLLGYQLNNTFLPGLGGIYSYNRETYQGGEILQYSVYGLKPFVQARIYKGLFAQGEYELLNVPEVGFTRTGIEVVDRFWVANPLAGLGYRNMISYRSFWYISVLYHFNAFGRSIQSTNIQITSSVPLFLQTGFVF